MKRTGHFFEFEIPDTWREHRDMDRFAYQLQDGGELIVSGRTIEGVGSVEELASVRERLLREAIITIEDTASHPDLVVKKPLGRRMRDDGLDEWDLHTETVAGDVLFSQAVLGGERAVLFVTYESPKNADFLDIFSRFLATIRYRGGKSEPGETL